MLQVEQPPLMHEHDVVPVGRDDIDLAEAAAVVAREDAVTVPAQVRRRALLAPGALRSLDCTGHISASSSGTTAGGWGLAHTPGWPHSVLPCRSPCVFQTHTADKSPPSGAYSGHV